MSNAYLDALKKRRTQYSLGRNLSASKEELASLIQEAIKHSPSSFNSQSSRAVILFGAESDKLWNLAIEEVRKVAPAESFPQTEAKLKSFAAGVGTVLFFEDQDVVRAACKRNSRCTPTTSRCGRNRRAAWPSCRSGPRWPTPAWAPACSTTIR